MQLGFVQYVTGDDVGAIKSFNTVISAEESNGEAWFNLGMVLFGQEQFTEAEYCFRHASELEAERRADLEQPRRLPVEAPEGNEEAKHLLPERAASSIRATRTRSSTCRTIG